MNSQIPATAQIEMTETTPRRISTIIAPSHPPFHGPSSRLERAGAPLPAYMRTARTSSRLIKLFGTLSRPLSLTTPICLAHRLKGRSKCSDEPQLVRSFHVEAPIDATRQMSLESPHLPGAAHLLLLQIRSTRLQRARVAAFAQELSTAGADPSTRITWS
jgi:hypothetical protein